MKIKEIVLTNFKRFTKLTIKDIPESAKLILLVGPNGSGKTSVFEAFNHWYKFRGFGNVDEKDYYTKDLQKSMDGDWYSRQVSITTYPQAISQGNTIKGKFYFRTAHRNEPTFDIQNLSRQNNPSENIQYRHLSENDSTVSKNYQRLVSYSVSELYNDSNDSKSVKDLREELIGKIRESLSNIFDDLQLDNIGKPLENGSFFFTKGTAKNFHYKNLSAGEKSAFDLILDLVVNSQYYSDAVFCIDEPEIHMHTALQAKLLGELYSLIPDNGQLWLTTHSMGMLKKAQGIEQGHPGTVVFFDFSNIDFDSENTLTPATIDATIWNKFLELAFDDFSKLIAPSTIVFCEGSQTGGKNQKFDEKIYQKIFKNRMPLVSFVSVGSCTDLLNPDNISMKIIGQVLSNSTIITLVDRDNRSTEEIKEVQAKGIRVLSRRHLECYLLDDEIIQKLCNHRCLPMKAADIISKKAVAMESSKKRGNLPDDVKSAAGEIVNAIRKELGIVDGGSTTHAFLRDTMAKFVTPDTKVYQDLEKDIFG